MTLSLPVMKKVVVSQIMDYQGDIHEKIEEKSFMLKICTATTFIRSTKHDKVLTDLNDLLVARF